MPCPAISMHSDLSSPAAAGAAAPALAGAGSSGVAALPLPPLPGAPGIIFSSGDGAKRPSFFRAGAGAPPFPQGTKLVSHKSEEGSLEFNVFKIRGHCDRVFTIHFN